MFDWINTIVIKKVLGSMLRHLLPLIATYLSALQLDPVLVERFTADLGLVAISLISYVVSQGLSFINLKKKG